MARVGRVVLGLDEVGRGAWAGPLVVGAVVLARPIEGLWDSKQLTARRRYYLAERIRAEAAGWSLGWVEPAEVDAVGLTASMRLACERALAGISAAYADIVLDGSYNFLSTNLPVRTMVRADVSVPAVSAASIVAKVARDAHMADIAARYPEYGFEKHVGYGTARHRAALLQYGPSPIHRRSFAPVRSLEQGHE